VKPQTTVSMVFAAALLLGTTTAGADIYTCPQGSIQWTGNAHNGSWNSAGNWSPRKVPGPASDVCIPTFGQANGAGLSGSASSISVHSITVDTGGALLLGSGKVSIAAALTNAGGMSLYGTTLSAGSIAMANPGEIDVFDNSSITSPAFSNTTGTLWVYPTGTLRLADNPVQLENGNLSGGIWYVDGTLTIPSDLTTITTEPGAAFETVVSVSGVLQDAAGNNPLETLTSMGASAVLSVGSLTIAQNFTSQGFVNAAALTVNGTYTLESGGAAGVGTSLTANSVSIQPGGSLEGGGTVVSSVTNNGNVSASGTLTVTGNYTQTSGGTLTEMFGSSLHVDSNATLSGALSVQVNPKHPPASGASYTALTAGSLSGSFTTHTAGFTLTTSGTSIQVTKQ
jgi:hypothetical protein